MKLSYAVAVLATLAIHSKAQAQVLSFSPAAVDASIAIQQSAFVAQQNAVTSALQAQVGANLTQITALNNSIAAAQMIPPGLAQNAAYSAAAAANVAAGAASTAALAAALPTAVIPSSSQILLQDFPAAESFSGGGGDTSAAASDAFASAVSSDVAADPFAADFGAADPAPVDAAPAVSSGFGGFGGFGSADFPIDPTASFATDFTGSPFGGFSGFGDVAPSPMAFDPFTGQFMDNGLSAFQPIAAGDTGGFAVDPAMGSVPTFAQMQSIVDSAFGFTDLGFGSAPVITPDQAGIGTIDPMLAATGFGSAFATNPWAPADAATGTPALSLPVTSDVAMAAAGGLNNAPTSPFLVNSDGTFNPQAVGDLGAKVTALNGVATLGGVTDPNQQTSGSLATIAGLILGNAPVTPAAVAADALGAVGGGIVGAQNGRDFFTQQAIAANNGDQAAAAVVSQLINQGDMTEMNIAEGFTGFPGQGAIQAPPGTPIVTTGAVAGSAGGGGNPVANGLLGAATFGNVTSLDQALGIGNAAGFGSQAISVASGVHSFPGIVSLGLQAVGGAIQGAGPSSGMLNDSAFVGP